MQFIYAVLMSIAFVATPFSSGLAQEYFWQQDQNSNAAQINDIEIVGNERIERNTILSYLNLSQGDRGSDSALRRSTRSLYSTGLFADVVLSMRGDTLVVRLAENPIINEIAFEGNKRIEDDELLSEINLRPRTVLTRTKVQDNVDRLYEIYRRGGRFSTSIDPKIIKLDQNRVNLVFEIDEGVVTKIKKISFVGNQKFSSDALRGELASKETRWYSFFTSTDRYDADRLNYDQELLRRFYLKNGYVDFNVKSANAELSKDRETFYVTFNIEEGKRYRVNEIDISSELKNFDANKLEPQISIKEGDYYNADLVEQSVNQMVDELGNQQFAFVDIRPDIQRNKENTSVDVTFKIAESPRVYVERIDIKGNVRTMDKVVRREFELVENDPFNKEKLAESEKNIRELGFFETVKVTPKPGSKPDTTVIETEVTEKSTGEVSIGAGFSTTDGPLADFRIRERNLLGTGRDLGFSTVIAGERTEFDVSLAEPYFLNRDLRATVNAFRITRDYQDESSFDQKRTGLGVSFNYPLSKRLRQTLKYRYEQNTIENVDPLASLFIQLQQGDRSTLAASQRLTYDARDSRIDPSEGYHLWLEGEVAGIADAQYVSGIVGGQVYVPVTDSIVFSFLTEGGHIQGFGGENVTISERYFVGGNTFRGFERSGIGPRDLVSNDALGGNTYYRGTAEFSMPVTYSNLDERGVKLHAFSDFGTLFDIDQNSIPGVTLRDRASLRVSTGMGLSWASPFGPLRMDIAKPVVKEDYDEEQVFKFSFGTRF